MDPYSAPLYPAHESTTEDQDQNSLPIIRSIVGAWEKNRITYNLTLIILGVFLFIYAKENVKLPNFRLYKISLLFILLANLFYFAGPIIEIYLCALSQKPPRKKIRKTLLIAGFTLSFTLMLLYVKNVIAYQNIL